MASSGDNKGGTRSPDAQYSQNSEGIAKAQVILFSPSLTPEDGDVISQLVWELGYTTGDDTHGAPNTDYRVVDTWTWGEDDWSGNNGAKVLVMTPETPMPFPDHYARYEDASKRFVPLSRKGLSLMIVACGGTQGDSGYQSLWVGMNFDNAAFAPVNSETEATFFWPLTIGGGAVSTGSNFQHILSESGWNLQYLLNVIDQRADYVGGQSGVHGTLIAPISSFVFASADEDSSHLKLPTGSLLRQGHHVTVIRADGDTGKQLFVQPAQGDVFHFGQTDQELTCGSSCTFVWAGTEWYVTVLSADPGYGA